MLHNWSLKNGRGGEWSQARIVCLDEREELAWVKKQETENEWKVGERPESRADI